MKALKQILRIDLIERLSPENLGRIYLVGGLFILALTDNLILLIGKEAGLWQFHFCRSLIALPALLILVKIFKFPIRPIRTASVLLRTVLITISMLLYFSSLPMMPLAVAAAGLFTSPIFVLIFSALFFRERIGFRRIIAVTLGAIGVWCILQPDTPEFSLFALIPVLAGAFYALNNITTRKLCSNEPPLSLIGFFYLSLGLSGAFGITFFSQNLLTPEFISTSPFVFSGWQTTSISFYFLVLLHAVFSLIAVAMITRAYQISQTSYITVFDYSFVVFIGIGGWIFWGQVLSVSNILGIVIIIFAGSIISFSKLKYNN